MSWCGFTPPLSRCEPAPLEILSAQTRAAAKGLYVQDSRGNVIGTMTFVITSIGSPDAINHRRVELDVEIRNFTSRCDFRANAEFYRNGTLFTHLDVGAGALVGANQVVRRPRTLAVPNGQSITVGTSTRPDVTCRAQ